MLVLARRVAFLDSPPSHLGPGPKAPPQCWLSGEVAIREMGIATLLWGLALPSLLLALCSPYLPPSPPSSHYNLCV